MSDIEDRVDAIEKAVAEIKDRLQKGGGAPPWWERICGTFNGSEEYQEAMRLGAEYRRSLRPDDEDEKP